MPEERMFGFVSRDECVAKAKEMRKSGNYYEVYVKQLIRKGRGKVYFIEFYPKTDFQVNRKENITGRHIYQRHQRPHRRTLNGVSFKAGRGRIGLKINKR